MTVTKIPKFLYGGDYNPDQWPKNIWQEDVRMFRSANINIASVGIFSWAALQPKEDQFNFSWLDEVIDLLYKNGVSICLATSTAAQPAWLSRKYPSILPVDKDGKKHKHGGRMNYCPNSLDFRKASQTIARKLAERYKDHPALALWHVSNEYGPNCYCDTCAAEFRKWVQKRYKTLEELNLRWYTNFWGHTLYDWEEIVLPSHLSEEFPYATKGMSCFQSISLDYFRFMSESNLACYLGERNILKQITPHIPVTTNLMGTFKNLNYFDWAKHLDVISWDNYPSAKDDIGHVAMRHDLMRSLKGDQPFLLMEQTPSQQNWQWYNSLKKPGIMRLWSYQSVAHGSDSVMFFQLRRSRGNCEKYHGALIAHAGHENTRVFQECKQLGNELSSLGNEILDSKVKSRVGILFDWENWWAVELSSGPSVDMMYVPQVEKYYKAFYNHNIPADLLPEEGDFSRYDLIVAPLMYMVKPGVAKRLEEFVKKGGTFITTFFSGIVNENDLVTMGGYPGELRALLGIWSEEIDALFPEQSNSIVFKKKYGNLKKSYTCGMLCDLIHAGSAKILAVYGKDFYKGRPVLTENKFGNGKAYYVASDPEPKFLDEFIHLICKEKGIQSLLETPEKVEVTQRIKGNKTFTFVLNHNPGLKEINLGSDIQQNLLTGKSIKGKVKVPGNGVLILQK